MAAQDYPFEQLKYKYLEADFKYRTNVLSTAEFNEIVVETLNELIVTCDIIHPYYDELKEMAEKQWLKAKRALPYLRPKRIELKPDIYGVRVDSLRKEFIVENINYRSKRINILHHNRFLSDFFSHILNATGSVEPYFTEIEEEAEKEWRNSKEFKELFLSKL